MNDKSKRKPRTRRTAAEVAASQNQLILRKLVQEGAIPEQRMIELIQQYLPSTVTKTA